MTPDHMHAVCALAVMKKGKHVMVHKPLSNRINEGRLIIDAARQSKVVTHFLPASTGVAHQQVLGWIKEGAIGTLREIHNWSMRPVWPQYTKIRPISRRSRKTSTGNCGWDPYRTVRIIPGIHTPLSGAGSISAAARCRTWASTACGRSFNSIISIRLTRSRPRRARSATSSRKMCAPRSTMISHSRCPVQRGCGSPPKGTGRRSICSGMTAA